MTDFDQANPNPDPIPQEPVDRDGSPDPSPEVEATPATPETCEKIIYRWSYAEERQATKRGSRRMPIYAVVMSSVFLVSFLMLLAILWVGRYDPELSVRPGVPGIHDDVAIDGVEQAKHVVTVIEVTTPNSKSSGSGIILRRDGYIATNHHVIDDAETISVTFYDGTTASAKLIGSSEIDDLAVIKVDRSDLPEATFAAYSDCYVGETVYAIGAPGGPDFGWTTTRGIISFKDREVKIYDENDHTLLKKLRLVQTDAMVNPGNSGGALVNTDGEVVGVVSMKLSEGYEGIGFAIPADGAVEILNAIIEGKDFNSSVSHKRPMLGITCVDVEKDRYYVVDDNQIKGIDASVVDQFKNEEVIHPSSSGVYVMGVSEGMDAFGKLQKGDIITAVDDLEIAHGSELTSYVNNLYVGDVIHLRVDRGGRIISVDLTLNASADTP